MSLNKCPDCGHEKAGSAPTCPKCGNTNFTFFFVGLSMKICLNYFAILTIVFFMLVPSLSAQEPGPDQFDITGFKLGVLGGPKLKKEIETQPEGYKCLDIKNTQDKLIGYSCYAPEAPSVLSYLEREDTQIMYQKVFLQMIFLFDEYNSTVWFIQRRVKLKEGEQPTHVNMVEAVRKKYGTPISGGNYPTPEAERWIFGRSGEKVIADQWGSVSSQYTPCVRSGENQVGVATIGTTYHNRYYTNLIIPRTFGEACGASLTAQYKTELSQDVPKEHRLVSLFTLTLYDGREQHDRLVAENAREAARIKKEKEIELERSRSVPAPSF